MKVLMINKFLYPNGGSETYIIKLGEALTRLGHEVQYFGMEHKERTLGNRVGAYTKNMDFHGAKPLDKLVYPIKTIYSFEARRQIRKVLYDFKPDVCHINNFNYQLTPSIIVEIDNWRKKTKQKCKIIYTAHDLQLVCPSHQGFDVIKKENCLKCLGGKYGNCYKNRCIHGSRLKSLIGTLEAKYWNGRNVYSKLDTIICCSDFMKKNLDTNPILASKTVTLHNFLPKMPNIKGNKADYVVFFGRYSYEKGVSKLIEACKRLPDIKFIFVGRGDYEGEISSLPNAENKGFNTGEKLYELIKNARFSVFPSVAYENCPYSVMESISLGTPVVGANTGGVPELIKDGVTGRIFENGNTDDLVTKIKEMWSTADKAGNCSANCDPDVFLDEENYCKKIMQYYE